MFPNDDPTIDGIQPWYNFGDYITGNCTSARSNPAAELSWYINHDKVRTGEHTAEGYDYNTRLHRISLAYPSYSFVLLPVDVSLLDSARLTPALFGQIVL